MPVKPKPKKAPKLEDLIQSYLNSKGQARKMLLGLIRLKDPKFKEVKESSGEKD